MVKTMAEYIEREALIKDLEADFNTDWADYARKNNFDKDYIDGVRDEYDDTLTIICWQKVTDVQPVSVIKELQEHIKQRILETAFNNGGIYGEVAEDIADRIDIWVDEFRRTENGNL